PGERQKAKGKRQKLFVFCSIEDCHEYCSQFFALLTQRRKFVGSDYSSVNKKLQPIRGFFNFAQRIATFGTALLFGRNDQLAGWKKAFLAHESNFCLLPSYFCLQEVCASVVFGSETNIRTIRKANSFVRFLKSTSSFRIPTSQLDGWKKAFLADESNFCLLPSYFCL